MSAVEENENERVATPPALKGDPDSNRLMARLLDKLDLILTSHGLAFRDSEDWNDYILELQALIFKFYDDETGGNSDYDPNSAPDSTSTSETCSEEEEDLNDDDDDAVVEQQQQSAKKQKK